MSVPESPFQFPGATPTVLPSCVVATCLSPAKGGGGGETQGAQEAANGKGGGKDGAEAQPPQEERGMYAAGPPPKPSQSPPAQSQPGGGGGLMERSLVAEWEPMAGLAVRVGGEDWQDWQDVFWHVCSRGFLDSLLFFFFKGLGLDSFLIL